MNCCQSSVRVALEEFKFNCAHFIAYPGYRERLHGHNYTVSVELDGLQSDVDGYIVDFSDVKAAVRTVCKSLNERFLVPSESEALKVCVTEAAYPAELLNLGLRAKKNVHLVTESGDYFSIPYDDCMLLPVKWTSAEALGEYIWTIIFGSISHICAQRRNLRTLTVEVYERPGQCARITRPLNNGVTI